MSTTTPTPDSTTAGTPSLIVTSGASRNDYSNNTNTLQAATSNISSTTSDPSVVNYLNKNNLPSDYGSRATLAKQNGINNYTGTAEQNTQLLGMLEKGTSDSGGGTTTTPAKPGKEDSADTSSDGMVPYTDDNGTTHRIDPTVKNAFDTSLSQLDTQIADAKSNLQSALSTMQNDPAAASAIGLIMQKYDQQIQAMKDKNRMVLGQAVVGGARTGMLQYANEMETNFMSEEQDKASKRVTDLITLETNMVLKAQAAYKKGDISAFSTATKALETATKDKTDAINKLLSASDKVVKEKQAETKQILQQQKQETSDNIRLSTAIAKTVAESIKGSGITDKKKIKDYITSMATANGITNPTILESAVVKAQSEQTNQDSIIKKRDSTKPSPDKPYGTFKSKPTPTEISKVNSYIQSIGGNQAAIDAVSQDEIKFYKVLNSVPKTTKNGTTPP